MRDKRPSFLLNPNFQGVVILLAVVFIGGFVLLDNRQGQTSNYYALPVNEQVLQATQAQNLGALENQIENPATAKPTQAPPPTADIFVPAVLPTSMDSAQVFLPPQVVSTDLPTQTPIPEADLLLTPTFPVLGSTAVPSPTGIVIANPNDIFGDSTTSDFAPPAEQDPPLSRQPNDHFFLRRPVRADANGRSLFYYPYGSTGQIARIHHGIDLPNPIGEVLVAANSGTVVWAGQSLTDTVTEDRMEVYASYGNFIVIEHDFSWQGKPIYTLYAHLEAILVTEGQRVEIGQAIGLVGDTGWSTGAHVHFEVRVGINNYWNTRNPLLWIVPYLGHGVIAGRIMDSEGNFVDDAIVQINRGGRQVDTTRTYMQPKQASDRSGHVVVDENWQENFVFGDVPAGQYEVVALVGNERFTRLIDVQSGMVNYVDFQINPTAATPIPVLTIESNGP